tara:strand:- start:9270 stop:9527 length:258 start_codon:yes stop_codon:yes gene_type:complete
MAGKVEVDTEASASFMEKAMEFAKNPTYVMMFLGAVFLLVIGFMMYKKPDMLKKLMNPSGSKNSAPNTNSLNDEEEQHSSQGEDL